MRRLLALLLLLAGGYAHAQGYRLSDKRSDGSYLFDYRWEDVPAPTVPMQQTGALPGVVYNDWVIAPAGTYEVRNALVDYNQRAGAWSEPRTLTLGEGWALWVSPHNLAPDSRAVAAVWKVKKLPDGPERAYVWDENIGGPHAWQSPALNAPLSLPKWHTIVQANGALLSRPGGLHTTAAPPPAVVSISVPNVALEAAYAFVTNNGETALSPVCTLPPTTAYNAGAGAGTFRDIEIGGWTPDEESIWGWSFLGAQRVPPGALGYHLYVRRPGGQWRRQVARINVGVPGVDDYLFQPDNNHPKLMTFREDTPGPMNTPRPQSYLDPLSVALKYTWANIVVDREIRPCCPIVDEYEGIVGPNLDPAGPIFSAAPAGTWANKINPNRTITATTSKIITGNMAPGCTHATYFPAILVQGRSSWVGVTVDAAGNGVRNCSAGVAFRDYSGGQCFDCKFTACGFGCRQDVPDWPTQAVRVLYECAGTNGHTASEMLFADCRFTGTTCVYLENSQTANIQFTGRTYATNFCTDCRCPAIWVDMPTPVTFEALYCQSSGTVISFGLSPNVSVQKVFVDQPFASFLDLSNQQPGTLSVDGGGSKINCFQSAAGVAPNLFRVVNATASWELSLRGVTIQCDAPGVRAVGMAPMRSGVLVEKGNLLSVLKLIEPSAAQWTQWCGQTGWDTIPPEPGYKFPVPPLAVMNERGVLVGNTQATTITLNSLSGSPQKVLRAAWEAAQVSP